MTGLLQVGELRVGFERRGNGPPLVLMHGAEASRHMFAELMPHLAEHFTVIAYDQRDCGDTEGPERPSTLTDLAGDAMRLIEALGFGRAHVFGSSFGGRVAQALALLHPASVDRLVLGSTWPLPGSYESACPDAARLAELRSQLPGSAEELATWFFPEAFLAERPALRKLFANARTQSARSSRRSQTVQTAIAEGAGAISAPTLLLAGEVDRVVPPQVTLSMADTIRHAEAVPMPGIGHVAAIQSPQRLAEQILRFLRAPSTRRGDIR
ncbi:3-oxoadipate enol-lactonase [Burkholderiales bacterium 8X]|nr:3-oxoadipate enol-lactonase [Burkholderiales bacterium 8X]